MPIKAKELPDVAIRRLRHTTSGSGKPCKAKHPVGGVSGLYLQCNPPVEGAKVGSRQWILRARVGTARHEFGLIGGPIINNSHTDIIDIESKLKGLDNKDINESKIKYLDKFKLIDYQEIEIKE